MSDEPPESPTAPTTPTPTSATLDPRDAARVGLCARCVCSRTITSGKGSTFWMCQAPGLKKYPPLPVLRCGSFDERA